MIPIYLLLTLSQMVAPTIGFKCSTFDKQELEFYFRYSGVGLFGNDDRNIPWNEVYSNLRMRGKRHHPPAPISDPIYPWEAAYSLRGKKVC